MILFLDNQDSFTYNLADYLSQLGVEYKIYRNDIPLENITAGNYNGIIISPGPGTPEKSGCLMEVIDYYHDKLPILGICLGHQAIGLYFGACLAKGNIPMHGKISTIRCDQDSIFKDLPDSYKVVRYHSLIVDKLPIDLISIATSETDEIMAMKHVSLPIYGLQFHPEALLTEYGIDVLRNWFILNKIAS